MTHQHLNFQFFYAVILALLVILSGCSVPTAPTSISPTATPVPTTALTHSLALPTRTPSPTLKPRTPIVAPSPTIAPTLTTDQEQTLVLELLQSNAGCRLPCWWGFTPGKTTWQTAQAFFASLGKFPQVYGNNVYTVDFNLPKHDISISLYIMGTKAIDVIWVGAGMVRNNEAVFGDPLFARDLQRYMLPQLLTTYGQPKEILIRTFSEAPDGGWIPFHLLLFYPQEGILIDYQGPGERKGDRLRWCPQNTNIALWLWSPEHKWTLEDIARIGLNFSLEELLTYRPLEEATGMRQETFYETFKDANNRICLETPVDLWP